MTIENKELTLKQRNWLAVYIQTGNATEAAMQTYDCKDRESAKSIGSQNLSKLNYSDLLEEAGLTDIKLVQVLLNGLQATKQLSVRTGMDANAESNDFIEVKDFQTIHRYLETALKLKRRLGNKNEVILENVPPMIVHLVRHPPRDNEPITNA